MDWDSIPIIVTSQKIKYKLLLELKPITYVKSHEVALIHSTLPLKRNEVRPNTDVMI